ncbi:MAG: amino acid-binding protein [Mycobacteriales bacterium]
MTYLMRLVLPDRPGSLGVVASAIGQAGGDIVSLDVVERGADGAVDDLIVELPPGGLADTLITAARSVPGVIVESLRPYPSGRDLHRDLELVDELAGGTENSLALLTDNAPGVFRAGWAMCLEQDVTGNRLLHASAGAPDPTGMHFPWLPLHSARRMGHSEDWVPERWDVLGMELAAAPVGRPDRVVLVGRPGGPRFRASEVLRLAHLAGITATVGELLPAVEAH